MKKLLILGASSGTSEIIRYAKTRGIFTIVADYTPFEKSSAKQMADDHWLVSTADIDQLEEKCRLAQVDGIICGASDFNVEKTIELSERLGVRSYMNRKTWHYSVNKADFKALCREVGAPVAEDYQLSDALTDEELSQVKFPVVVKPVDLSGNRGISYCYSKEELIEAYHLARAVSSNPKIIVERMFVGQEWYSYYAMADGEYRQVALNAMEAEPGHLKNLYSLTTTVTCHVKRFMQEVNPAIEAALHKVGCRDGIAWVQVMLDQDDHFYIIEMGYRLPGDMPFVAYPEVCGFDSVKWVVDYVMGFGNTPADLPQAQTGAYKKCGCGYSLWTHKEGVIQIIDGVEKLSDIPGVRPFLHCNVGDKVGKHRSLGVISVTADNCDEFCQKIDQINHTISIVDETGEDVIIRYTDFDYLKRVYKKGLAE